MQEINGDLMDLLRATRTNPEKYKGIKDCKNLDEVYYFIKKIHPEYTFSKEELENLVLGFANAVKEDISEIPEKKLNISGGTDNAVNNLIARWEGTAKYLSNLGNSVELTSELLFAKDNINLDKISRHLLDISEGRSHSNNRFRKFEKVNTTKVRGKRGRQI